MNAVPIETEWQRIEREAREQAREYIQATELRPLEHGQPVAWAECRFGRTNDLSLVHRAGEETSGATFTLCGELVPAVVMRVALTPNLARTLGRCRYCEQEHAKTSKEAA